MKESQVSYTTGEKKTLQKAVNDMKDKVDIQCNKIFCLEDSMVMYGVYNLDTLEDLIKTVHNYTQHNYME